MRRNAFLAIVAAASLMGACNGADRTDTARDERGAVGTAGKAEANKASMGDKDFVHDVSMANTAEIELGRLAAEHGSNAEVKKFGRMMVDDHTAAGSKLKALASNSAIDWPTELDSKYRNKHDDLAKEQGADFDRDYISHMVDAHGDLVDKLESRIDKKNLADWKADRDKDNRVGKRMTEDGKAVEILPEKSDNAVTMRINQWAASVYPTAYKHLQEAKQINDAIKGRRTN